MFLLYLTLCSVLSGSLAEIAVTEECYGSNFRVPQSYSPTFFKGQLLFSRASDGEVKLLLSNGEVKDPRVTVYSSLIYLNDLTEKDEGSFLVSYNNVKTYKIINLKILDCAEEITRYYGSSYTFDIPRQADYLQFTTVGNLDEIMVLWNRSNPYMQNNRRGELSTPNKWEIQLLTQADNGYYTFRKKSKRGGTAMVSRKQLSIHAKHLYRELKEKNSLYIEYPVSGKLWTVTFQSAGSKHPITLVETGQVVDHDDWSAPSFMVRANFRSDAVEISDLETADSGVWEFKDEQGNLAQTLQIEIHEVPMAPFAIGIVAVVAIAVVLLILYCVKICCCKKSSCKRDEPQTEAAPSVYYHDRNQPAGPHYSAAPTVGYSHQRMNLLTHNKEPSVASSGPSAGVVGGGGQREVNNPLNINVNPPQPEVAPAISVGSNFLSSDLEPTFELKGLTFPSAPPLSSDSTFCDVYTSNKLNFP